MLLKGSTMYYQLSQTDDKAVGTCEALILGIMFLKQFILFGTEKNQVFLCYQCFEHKANLFRKKSNVNQKVWNTLNSRE